MQEALSEVEERGPRSRLVREEKGLSKDADDDVRSPPTIYPHTQTFSSPTLSYAWEIDRISLEPPSHPNTY